MRALVKDEELDRELLWICELVYHMNPTLRTHLTVTGEETDRLAAAVERLRVQCKSLVRLIYCHCEQGHPVPDMLLDLANLLSGYFFFLAMKLNETEGVEEIDYVSRNY